MYGYTHTVDKIAKKYSLIFAIYTLLVDKAINFVFLPETKYDFDFSIKVLTLVLQWTGPEIFPSLSILFSPATCIKEYSN